VPFGGERPVHLGRDELEQLLAQDGAHVLRRTSADDLHPGTEPVDEVLRGADPDVRAQEDVLDLFPGVLVEGLAGQQGEEPLAQRRLRARQARPQADQATGRRRGALERRRDVAVEQRVVRREDGRPATARAVERVDRTACVAVLARVERRRPSLRGGRRQVTPLAAAGREEGDPHDQDEGGQHSGDQKISTGSHSLRPTAPRRPRPLAIGRCGTD
jgi:hypothetical protein